MLVLTIAWREFRSAFTTTVGWLVLAGFLLLAGTFWARLVGYYVAQSADMLASPYGSIPMNYTDYLLMPFFGDLAIVLMMVCPAVSMRLFSDELKHRTIELLHRRADVLHRQGRQSGESLRPLSRHGGDFIIHLTCQGPSLRGVQIVAKQWRMNGYNLHVNTLFIHVFQALFRCEAQLGGLDRDQFAGT